MKFFVHVRFAVSCVGRCLDSDFSLVDCMHIRCLRENTPRMKSFDDVQPKNRSSQTPLEALNYAIWINYTMGVFKDSVLVRFPSENLTLKFIWCTEGFAEWKLWFNINFYFFSTLRFSGLALTMVKAASTPFSFASLIPGNDCSSPLRHKQIVFQLNCTKT